METNIVLFARSSDPNGELQLKQMRDFFGGISTVKICAEFSAIGQSGDATVLETRKQAKLYAIENKCRFIVCIGIDRWTRNFKEYDADLSELMNNGCFLTTLDGFDGGGEFFNGLLNGDRAERIKHGKEYKKLISGDTHTRAAVYARFATENQLKDN